METVRRELYSTIPEDQQNPGIIILLFIATFYMCGFVYYIYKKYLSIIFEDLICLLDGKENEDSYRPIVYSALNSLSFLILCFFSVFSSESDLGIASVLGSDAFNIFFILPCIFIKFKESNHGILDTWITFRDTFIYIIGIITVLLFLIFKFVNLWAAIILMFYYFVNYIFIAANQDIKEKVMEWIGLTNEDNEFNSDEHFNCRKRRESLTQLQDQGFFDDTDINLQKKLNMMEALLVIKFGSGEKDNHRKKVHHKFQKAVYQIIFAIRNQAKAERQKRTEYYVQMQRSRKPDNGQQQNLKPNDLDHQDSKIDKQQSNQVDDDEDRDPLIGKNQENNKNNPPPPVEQENSNKLMAENNEYNQVQQQEEQPQNEQQNQQDDSYIEQGVNLKMPKSIGEKILYIIFFPVHLILYLLPNYLENPIPKKLVLCFFLNILLLCGCLFLIDWWVLEISKGTGIPLSILGILLTGICLSIHFIEYNIKVAREEKQLEYVQSFFQIGICKISMCCAIPWVFRVIVKLDIDVSLVSPKAFGISLAIYAGIIFLLLFVALFSKFKLGPEEGIKMGVLYFIFIVVSTIIIALNI